MAKLVDVGVLAPDGDGTFTEGDVRRTRLYQGLERTGLPLEAIREALDAGELSFGWLDNSALRSDRPAQLTFVPGRRHGDRHPAGAAQGAPRGVRLRAPRSGRPDARGRAPGRPADPEARLRDSPRPSSIGWSACTATRSAGSPRSRRTGGTRFVVLPRLASGMTEVEMHEATLAFGVELAPLLEQALLAMYHAHQEHTWTENLIGEIEDALDRTGLRSRLISRRRSASSTSPATRG